MTPWKITIKAELTIGAVMALSFKGLEPVAFGGRDCQPKLTAELKLRLGNIKKMGESADEILAGAFPDDREFVLDFLRNKMTDFEKQQLMVYLIGGEEMLAKINEQTFENLNRTQEGENEGQDE